MVARKSANKSANTSAAVTTVSTETQAQSLQTLRSILKPKQAAEYADHELDLPVIEDEDSIPAIEFGRTYMVSAPLVEFNPDNSRKAIDLNSIKELAASIKQSGLLQSIVGKLQDGKIWLEAGERRTRAHMELRRLFIKCTVMPGKISVEHSTLNSLTENLQREDLSEVDEARAYQRLIAEFGYSVEQIATKIGVAKFRVEWRLKLMNLCPEVLAVYEKGYSVGEGDKAKTVKLTKTQARLLGELLTDDGKPDADKQLKLLDLIKQGKCNTDSALKSAVAAIKSAEVATQQEADIVQTISPVTQAKINALLKQLDQVSSVLAQVEREQADGAEKECISALPASDAEVLIQKLEFAKATVAKLTKQVQARRFSDVSKSA